MESHVALYAPLVLICRQEHMLYYGPWHVRVCIAKGHGAAATQLGRLRVRSS
jgi:hypothetical protein